jgi:hypothetical protein
MAEFVELGVADVTPSRESVLGAIGVESNAVPDDRVKELVDQGIELFSEMAVPRAMYMPIELAAFWKVYAGEGHNEADTPLDRILPKSQALALFAVTVGERVSRCIAQLFSDNDFALGFAVDAAASQGAERVAEAVESQFRDQVRASNPTVATLAFSPGYCGWHVTAQKKLFKRLDPVQIEISLNESCLMTPLKSISGVIVAGDKEIFDFSDDYPFCDLCASRNCRERLEAVKQQWTK